MYSISRYGETALVTGASSGIGKAYAQCLAKEGINLVVVARRLSNLEQLATDLNEQFGVSVHCIAQDLSEPDAAEKVVEALGDAGVEVDILINNAGFGAHGNFSEIPLERQLAMINLSCRLPVALTHKLLVGMKMRGRGAIIFLSSQVGAMPVPFMATYSATKAFPLFLGESLYGELAGTGIDVLAVLPGDTATEFTHEAGLKIKNPLPQRTADDVVASTFNALGKKPSVVDGKLNKLASILFGLMPKKAVIKNNARIWKT